MSLFVFVFSLHSGRTLVTEEDTLAFNQYGCIDCVPVDIHSMKSHFGAPDFTRRRAESGNSKDTFNDSETEV